MVDSTAGQVLDRYNPNLEQHIKVMNTAWNLNAGVSVGGTSTSLIYRTDRKGKRKVTNP